jgi:tetratricopeptide (TPR) repeat protein
LRRADDAIPLRIISRAQVGAGRLAWCQDRDDDALRHLHNARLNFEKLGLNLEVGFVHAFLGFTERNLGHDAAARKHFERAQTIGQEERSEKLIATAFSGLGSLEADQGDFATARKLKEKSLKTFRDSGDSWIVGLVAWSLGKVCVSLGEHEVARGFLRESLVTSRELGNKWSVPYALEAIADICAVEGKVAKAIRLYGSAAAQRAAFGLSFSAGERGLYEEGLVRLRGLTTARTFDSEWAAGQKLGMQAAIDLAMDVESTGRRSRRRPP